MDFEGTILTEGMGVGRGTRFATPEANRRLDTGGRERGIEGGKGGINPGAALNIDPGAAHVRARPLDPLQTKPIITDGSGISAKAISNVGDILSRAAFDYADRQAENEATAATLAFNERARVAFYGNPDDPKSKGLTGLQGAAAVSAREGYFGAIDKDYAETVASLSPAAKQKAIARISGIRDTALNRGASHIAQEQHNYEIQLRAAAVEDMSRRELPLDYHNAPNLKIALLKEFGQDTVNGNKAWDSAAIEGGHRLYLEAYKRSDQNNPTGMASLLSYREQVAPTMSTKALNDLDTLIKSFETHEIQAQKAAKIDAKNRETEYYNNLTVKAMDLIDNGVALRSPIEIAQHPEIADVLKHPAARREVVRYYEHRQREQAEGKKQERLADFNTALWELSEQGAVFQDKFAFRAFANSYNIYNNDVINSTYKDLRSSLSSDELVLRKQYMEVLSSAGVSFTYGEQTQAAPEKTGNPVMDNKALMDFYFTKAARADHTQPQELRKFKEQIYSIVTDSSKTPAERSKLLSDHVREVAKMNPNNEKLKGINPMDVVATNFRTKFYADSLMRGQRRASAAFGGDPTSRLVNDQQDVQQEPIARKVSKDEADYVAATFGASTPKDVNALYTHLGSGVVQNPDGEPLTTIVFLKDVSSDTLATHKKGSKVGLYRGLAGIDSSGRTWPIKVQAKKE